MNENNINRINILAKKAKESGLTQEETEERDGLRREYIDSMKGSLRSHLDNMSLVDEKGNQIKVKPKK